MESMAITGILKPKEGFEEQLLVELKKVQLASRKELGCIKYDLHQSVEDHTFVLYEIWESSEAFEHHIKTNHYQEYRENIAGIISSREVYKMRLID